MFLGRNVNRVFSCMFFFSLVMCVVSVLCFAGEVAMSDQTLSAKRSKLSRFLEEAENNYKVHGTHNVPVQYFAEPGEEIEDRDLDPNHVAKLAREFQLHGPNNLNIEVFVLFVEESWNALPADPLEGFSSLQAFLDAKPDCRNKLREHIGWHSTNAV